MHHEVDQQMKEAVRGGRDTSAGGTETACPLCNGTGWISTNAVGNGSERGRSVVRCACALQERLHRLELQAQIPPRYAQASFENFTVEGPQERFAHALLMARRFTEEYLLERVNPQGARGLLLTGSVGTGKTHLAVAVLRALLQQGIQGRFYSYDQLLKEIQSTYQQDGGRTELDLLLPAFESEVLVLDDLGTVRPSDWVFNTVTLVLNQRYNQGRTTILTTNHALERTPLLDNSLSARVGERVVSRLREMCKIIVMDGPDYRSGADPSKPWDAA